MDFTEDGMEQIKGKEKGLLRLFEIVLMLRGRTEGVFIPQKWDEEDTKLHDELVKKQKEAHEAILDNFNTPAVLTILWDDFLHSLNNYLKRPNPKLFLVSKATGWIVHFFKIFGVEFPEYDGRAVEENGEGEVSIVTKISVINPYITAVADFRKKLRELVLKEKKSNPEVKVLDELLNLADEFRDDVMPKLGIRFEDGGTAAGPWSYVPPERLVEEIAERKKLEGENRKKAAEKKKVAAKNRLEELKNEIEEERKMLVVEGKDALGYQFENGEPVSSNGKALSKKDKTKAKKALAKYDEKRNKLRADVEIKGEETYWREKNERLERAVQELLELEKGQ